MSRRDRDERKKRKYASVRDAAQKMSMGYTASYLKVPSGKKVYKPKAGTALLDILPYEVGQKNPVAEEGMLWWEYTFYVHKGIGPNQETFICPARTSKKRCPICEHREKLIKKEDPDDEKLIKALSTRQRQLINLRDRKNPDDGVQLFEVSNYLFGDDLMEQISGADEDEGWDLFFTIEDGKTLKVQFVEDSFGGRGFVRANRFDFKDRDPLSEEDLEGVQDLESCIKELSYDELKAKFLAVGEKEDDDDDDDDDDGDDEDEAPKSKRAKKPSKDEDEDEDADEGDEDDDEPKSKKKKPSKDEDDDDGEADEDGWDNFDEDDDEEEPKLKKSKKKSDDDEDDEDEDADEEEKDEDADDDDDEEEEKPKRRGRRASKADEDDD